MDALALYRRGRYWEVLALAQQRGELTSAALALLARLPEQDPRYPAARSWVKRLSARYR